MKQIILKKALLILFTLLCTEIAVSQVTGDYRSVATGNWTTLSTWQYYNGTSWVTPSGTTPQGYPGQFSGTQNVLIQSGNTVTFLETYSTVTFTKLTVSGTLNLSGAGGAPIFNIKTNTLIVTSGLTPTATINFATKGTLSLPANATLQVGTGGLTGACTANQDIKIGTTTFATCTGGGSTGITFSALMSSGGTLNAIPVSNSPVCFGNTINLNGSITGSAGTGLTYTWTITNPSGGVSTVNSQNTSLTATITGTYTAKLVCSTSYSGVAYSNEETISIIVNPLPIVITSADSVICANKVTEITASGAASYVWSANVAGTLFSDAAATVSYTGTNISTIYVKSPSTINVTATGTTLGCNGSDTTTLTVNSPATWNGISWSTTPTADRGMIFNGNFSSTSDLSGCSCVVNSGNVVINSTNDMLLSGSVTVSGGSLTFENNSNLIQTENVTNSGNITVKRNSSALLRLDYTLWSSPVAGQNLLSFSPATLTNRFYTFNTASNLYSAIAPSTNFAQATSYLIRVPNNFSTSTPTVYEGIFSGTPNNGTISKSIIDGGSATTRYNAIGNPYPSALKMDDFITANSANIEGTLYFWRKTNNDANPISYSTCTTAGCTLNNGHTYPDDNTISTGQGFLVQAKPGASTVIFTNSMRSSSNVNQFFRTSNSDLKNRFWLELKNSSNLSLGNKLIAYVEDATLDFDPGKDGLFLKQSQTSLTSIVNQKELIIQARPSFNVNDIVPLMFRTNIADSYTISLSKSDGFFANEQDIYLKDNSLNILHDLKDSPYTFESNIGNFEDRFEIVYKSTLSTNDNLFTNNSIIVYKDKKEIVIHSNSKIISNVTIYDINGRKLYEKSDVNLSDFKVNINTSNQVLLIKTTTIDNITSVNKIVN